MNKKHLLIFAGFVLFIMLIYFGRIVYLSFTEFNMLTPPVFIGLKNYRVLFTDDFVFRIALRNTLIIYSFNFIIIGVISLFVSKLLRKFSKIALYSCTFILLIVSICFINGLFDSFIMNIWDRYTQSLAIVIFYFFFSVFGIMLTLLSISYERLPFITAIANGIHNCDCSQSERLTPSGVRLPAALTSSNNVCYKLSHKLRPILAFTSPIIVILFLENSVVRLVGFPSINYDAHTLNLHAFDYLNMRLLAGYASAVSVINIVVIVTLVAVGLGFGLFVHKIMSNKNKIEAKSA